MTIVGGECQQGSGALGVVGDDDAERASLANAGPQHAGEFLGDGGVTTDSLKHKVDVTALGNGCRSFLMIFR